MKKLWSALCLILVLSMLLSPLSCAADYDYNTLADWEIKVAVPDNATAVLKGSEYYLYARTVGSIPYVMLRTYNFDSAQQFLTEFIAARQKERADLELSSDIEMVTVGNKLGYEVDYNYSVSGNRIYVRLIAITVGERTYAFLSKEVPGRNMTVGSMLEDVIANSEFLAEDSGQIETLDDELSGSEISLYPAYMYCLSDGMPKYWLDFSGVMADVPVLHCYFRSGDPTWYERCYYLDLATAVNKSGRLEIQKVTDQYGNDVSEWFTRLTLRFEEEGLSMNVRRNASTLAGGSSDNILNGVYDMVPASVGRSYRYYQKNGELKYWLVGVGGGIELHAMFRSDSPEAYEEVFILDLGTAEQTDYSAKIKKVYKLDGTDVSNWFKSIVLTEVQGAIMMNVQRDERTLAGGAEDNILTDVYLFEPRTYLLPDENVILTPSDLGYWAQIYYFTRTGFFPPEADVTKNRDGSYSIHLYEIVKSGKTTHTATSAWYTVDRYGDGANDITGMEVHLLR